MQELSIGQAAAFSGLSVDTLRYYERAGLLQAVSRAPSGHRRYSTADLERLGFLVCLRATSMPIRYLREFAELTLQGTSSLAARVELLQQHENDVLQQIEELGRALEIIRAKRQRLAAAQERKTP